MHSIVRIGIRQTNTRFCSAERVDSITTQCHSLKHSIRCVSLRVHTFSQIFDFIRTDFMRVLRFRNQ